MVIALALAAVFGAGIWELWLAATRVRRAAAPVTGPFWPRRALSDRFRLRLERAGLARLHPGAVVVAAGIAGGAAASTAFLTTGVVVVAGIAGIAGCTIPSALVGWRVRQRRRALRDLWPDVLDHLVASLRSGAPLPEAIERLATSGPEALRGEFAQFGRSYRVGGSFEAALDELKARLGSPAADRILETVRLAREVGGGEVTAILRELAGSLRTEQAIRHEVEGRRSWVVNAARLGVAAPWIVLAMLATRPEAAAAYNSPSGAMVILAGLAISVAAYAVMRRIGEGPPERRHFA